MDADKIFEQISSLQTSQVFSVYLQSQNSCVLIRMLSNEQNNKAIISSFQAQLDNKTIMSLNGCVKTIFPQYSFYIEETDILKSKSFSELLSDLGNNPIAESKFTSRKAGSDRVEERDVASPRFVYEWVSSMLSGFCSNSNYPKTVIKKIRDDVVHKDAYLPFRRLGKIKFYCYWLISILFIMVAFVFVGVTLAHSYILYSLIKHEFKFYLIYFRDSLVGA